MLCTGYTTYYRQKEFIITFATTHLHFTGHPDVPPSSDDLNATVLIVVSVAVGVIVIIVCIVVIVFKYKVSLGQNI